MSSIKALLPSDFNDLCSLVAARSTFLSVTPASLEAHRQVSLNAALNLLSTPGMGSVFGLYEDSKLMGAVFTIISSTHPCYYIQKAYTDPSASKATLASLFEGLIQHYEKLGYRRFYTMYREQDIPIYHRLWRTSSVLSDYISYNDLEVKPNIRPKHSEFWELLFGRMLFQDTMVIRGFVSKKANMFFNDSRDKG